MRALIDADGVVFRCGFAVEHKKYKFYIKGEEHNGPFQIYEYKRDIPKELQEDPEVFCEESVEVEPLQNALFLVKQELEGIISATNADRYSCYIKGKGNFREEVSVTRKYKGNRDPAHRPIYEQEIRDYLEQHWQAEEVDGMETDDKVAMEQGEDTIICSMDKDLDQVPGWHYNFHKKNKYWIDEDTALRNFYIQLLAGDASDNVQGVEGIGVVKASKYVAACKDEKEMFLLARDKYLECYGEIGLDILYEMANLIWMKRSIEDQWQPPAV